VDESQIVIGDGPDSAGGTSGEAITSMGLWDLVRMLLVLGAVIGVIYVVFFILKRTAGGRYEETSMIHVLGSQPLPGNKLLHLVEIGSQVFLVASGDHAVNLISEIRDQESIDEIRLKASSNRGAVRRSFGELLSSIFQNGAGAAPSGSGGTEPAGEPFGFMQQQKERLRKLR